MATMQAPLPCSAARLRGARVLLVDDDEDFVFGLGQLLRRHGLDLGVAASGSEAFAAIARASWDIVMLDLGLPDRPGLEVLGEILARDPFCSVIVLTGRDEARTAVAALRLGAVHYLTKPASFDEILVALEHASERHALRLRLEAALREAGDGRNALGQSPAWREALAVLEAAARAPRTQVLLTGESGTGKELAASLLHTWSDRTQGPFVAVNTASFSPSLLESELFGHVAGAFTGARGMKRGLLELASGGTLFLDEVGELPIELQPKLLRVLEGHPFRRVGGDHEIRVDVRFLSATNRPLVDEVKQGRFRLDLYHRLRVVEITLPPLRERGDDVDLLTVHFVSRFAAEMGKPGLSILPQALQALRAYAWPGNVRELRNVIERAVVLCRSRELDLRDLPPEVLAASLRAGAAPSAGEREGTPAPLTPLEDVIRDHVLCAFRACGENVTRTAGALGIGRVALRRRLKAYGIHSAEPQELD